MKTDICNIYHPEKQFYMKMPFAELVNVVFENDSTRKTCSIWAVKALILRLEHIYNINGFGDSETGNINELEAFLASQMALVHKKTDADYPTTFNPSAGYVPL